jgi:MoxR-like ATPase
LQYERAFFDPKPTEPLSREEALIGSDRGGRRVYVYTDPIILAVNVALAANRPLLVSGPPGSGKSSLAANIAQSLEWPYASQVITARTQARDLLWRFDAVQRLHDATLPAGGDQRQALDPVNYVVPGVLWQAFKSGARKQRMVVLLDEIDKADPDVPNSLLVALGASEFEVEDLRPPRIIRAPEGMTPLVVVTTNDERELSRPFLRRCVSLTLRAAKGEQLVEIAAAQGLAGDAVDRKVATELAAIVDRLRIEAKREGNPPPSTAEYLDAVRACLQLGVRPDSDAWQQVERATLRKRLDPEEDEADPWAPA